MKRYLPWIVALLLSACAAYGQSGVRSETIKIRYIGPYYLTDTIQHTYITYSRLIEQVTITFRENSVTVTGNEKGIKDFKDYLAILDVEPIVYWTRIRLVRVHREASGKLTETVVMSASPSVLAPKRGIPATATEIVDPSGYSVSVTLTQNTDTSVTITSAVRQLGAEGEIVSSGKNTRKITSGDTVRTVGMTEEKDKELRRSVHRGEIVKNYGEYSGYYLDVKLEPRTDPAIAQVVGKSLLSHPLDNAEVLVNAVSHTKAVTIRPLHIGEYGVVEALKSNQGIEQITLDFRNHRVIVRGDEKAILDARATIRYVDVPRRYYFVKLRLVRYHVDANGTHAETTVVSPTVDAYNNQPASYPEYMQNRKNDYTIEITISPNPDKTLTLISEVSELDDEGQIVSSGKNTRVVNLWNTVRTVGMTGAKDKQIRKAVHQGDMPNNLGEYSGYYLDVKVEPRAAPGNLP